MKIQTIKAHQFNTETHELVSNSIRYKIRCVDSDDSGDLTFRLHAGQERPNGKTFFYFYAISEIEVCEIAPVDTDLQKLERALQLIEEAAPDVIDCEQELSPEEDQKADHLLYIAMLAADRVNCTVDDADGDYRRFDEDNRPTLS